MNNMVSGIGQNIPKGSAEATANMSGEEIFGTVIDANVIRRFIEFVTPYRKTI